MGGYFKPLRRRIGVLALGLACLFSVGWVRSLRIWDVVTARLDTAAMVVESNDGHLQLLIAWNQKPFPGMQLLKWDVWDTEDLDAFMEDQGHVWIWRVGRLGVITSPRNQSSLIVPYWVVIVPLTLISAWLLLSKPRIGKRKAITEPDAKATA